jgi:hypothetical protein
VSRRRKRCVYGSIKRESERESKNAKQKKERVSDSTALKPDVTFVASLCLLKKVLKVFLFKILRRKK